MIPPINLAFFRESWKGSKRKGDFFILPLCFESVSGYRMSLKLEHMILRLTVVISGTCYYRKSYSSPVRVHLKESRSKAKMKSCFCTKTAHSFIALSSWEKNAVRVEISLKITHLCKLALKNKSSYKDFCFIVLPFWWV